MSTTWCRTNILARGAQENLVSKNLCSTDVLEQKKLVFVEKRPLAPKAGPRVYPQQPIGTTQSMKEKIKICSERRNTFRKQNILLGRDLEEYGDNKKGSFTIEKYFLQVRTGGSGKLIIKGKRVF